jgi:hypothetical protein
VSGGAKEWLRQPYRRRAERGRSATAARLSDTRGFGHRRLEWHGSAVTDAGRARLGSDVACLDTCGRERGAASDRLSGRAAGRRFMAWACTWKRCRGSWRQLEMEHRHVGPGAESGDRQVGPRAELFLN